MKPSPSWFGNRCVVWTVWGIGLLLLLPVLTPSRPSPLQESESWGGLQAQADSGRRLRILPCRWPWLLHGRALFPGQSPGRAGPFNRHASRPGTPGGGREGGSELVFTFFSSQSPSDHWPTHTFIPTRGMSLQRIILVRHVALLAAFLAAGTFLDRGGGVKREKGGGINNGLRMP